MRSPRHSIISLSSSLLVALVSLAWTFHGAEGSSSAFQPTFGIIPCPEDITVIAEDGNVLTCGYLTVLEDRSDPAGGTIRLFVLEAAPEGGDVTEDPIYVTGRDLVGRSPWAIPFGYRVGRLTLSMDRRGAGRSEPSLACPEVRHLTTPTAGIVLGSEEMRSALLNAVETCHDRLTSEGIDLDRYNLADMAADAEDLRVALGFDQWNLLSYGTASSLSLEIIRRYPEHVRSATFDSPLPPTVDRFTGAIEGTEYALDQIAAACSIKLACDEAYPHLHAAWNHALRRLDEQPSTFNDEDLHVIVDDATAVRYLRNNMALGINETDDISRFPLSLVELQQHGWENGGPAGNQVGWASTPPLYVGYEVQWGDPGAFHFAALAGTWVGRPSEGTFYSYMCSDEVPFVDHPALEDAGDDRPWYVDAYVNNPYVEICDRWNVAEASTDPHLPVASDVPVLVMSGRFDPYSPYPLVKEATTKLSNATVLRVPARSRNALSVDCTGELRNSFVTDPTTSLDTSCLREIHELAPIRFVLPPPPSRGLRAGEAVISTVAGDGAYGSSGDGDIATSAQLGLPSDVAVDAKGNVYVLESEGERVRRVDAGTGLISTIIGPPTGGAPPAPGDASAIELGEPSALAVDDDGDIYVGGGGGSHRMVLRVDPSSGTVVHIAGTGEKGFSGDGGPATEARTTHIRDIAVDDRGNVYFSDFQNNRIRKVDTDGIISTIAGTGERGSSGDGGPAVEAQLNRPTGIYVDGSGVVYIVDQGNERVRRIDSKGVIRTFAGNGKRGYAGDGGPAKHASVGHPSGVTADARGNVFIASQDCFCVRRVDLAGVITTVVGRGIAGFSGDGGPALLATLSDDAPRLALGPDGALYIVDASNARIRKVVFP